jgi:murein DD-endopeptidase MepM/ murein hydrolase activator NlpD
MNRRSVTIVLHTDGEIKSRQYRVPLWAVRAGQGAALAFLVAVLLFLAFAGPITRSAARVPGLEAELARLRSENTRVQELAAALNRAESNYQQLRAILGARAPDPAAKAPPRELPRARPMAARAPGQAPQFQSGPSVPAHWPLDDRGFLTRGQVSSGSGSEAHPGVDIAVPVGTPVRAAGGGTVALAGVNDDYGMFVRVRHPEGYETMYGHASRLLVRDGDQVDAGQVIALSGSTGRSTAPHLHFEIRRGGRSIDPFAVVKEGS